MGFNYVDLLLINDLVEHPELFVLCALTNECPAFMQLLVLPTDFFLCYNGLSHLNEACWGGWGILN